MHNITELITTRPQMNSTWPEKSKTNSFEFNSYISKYVHFTRIFKDLPNKILIHFWLRIVKKVRNFYFMKISNFRVFQTKAKNAYECFWIFLWLQFRLIIHYTVIKYARFERYQYWHFKLVDDDKDLKYLLNIRNMRLIKCRIQRDNRMQGKKRKKKSRQLILSSTHIPWF